MRTGRTKRGFTLIETVVTVGIVAAMAAVVIPQVARQFDAADPARIQNDLKNIQTAIETFTVNVRAFPGDLDDLANQIATSGNVDTAMGTGTTLAAFAGSENTLWQGPYLDQAIVQAATDDSITTAFGARIMDSFVCFGSTNSHHGVSKATNSGITLDNNEACPASATGQKFIAVQITGVGCTPLVSTSTFMAINEVFDGVNEANADLNGRIRCFASGAGTTSVTTAVVFFLAVPLT